MACRSNKPSYRLGVTSSNIGDGTGDHYLVLDDPAAAYDIVFDKAYDVDFFLLGGGGGGSYNRGGAGGSGAAIIFMNYRVEKDKAYQFMVGAKGTGSTADGVDGNNGMDSNVTVDSTIIFSARGGGGGTRCCSGASGNTGGSSGSSGTNHGNAKAGRPNNVLTTNIIPQSSMGTATIQTGPTTDSTLRYRVLGNNAGFSDLTYPNNLNQLDSDGAGGIGSQGSPRIKYSTQTTHGQPGRGGDGAAETQVQNRNINFKNYFSSSSVVCNGVDESGLCYYAGGGHGSTTCDDFTDTTVQSPKDIRSLGGGGLSALQTASGTYNGQSYAQRVNAIGSGSGGAGGHGNCGSGVNNGGDGSDGLIMIRIKEFCAGYYVGPLASKTCTACSPPTASLDASLAHWLRFEDPAALNFDSITGAAVGTLSQTSNTKYGQATGANGFIGNSLNLYQQTSGSNCQSHGAAQSTDRGLAIDPGGNFFGTRSWTFAVFVKISPCDRHEPIISLFSKTSSSTSDSTMAPADLGLIWLSSESGSGTLRWMTVNGDNLDMEAISTINPDFHADDNYVHVAAVFFCHNPPICTKDLSTLTFYWNGVEHDDGARKIQNTHASTQFMNRDIKLGYDEGDTRYGHALYDDLRIYSRVLTQPEIALLAGQSSPTTEISLHVRRCAPALPPRCGCDGYEGDGSSLATNRARPARAWPPPRAWTQARALAALRGRRGA